MPHSPAWSAPGDGDVPDAFLYVSRERARWPARCAGRARLAPAGVVAVLLQLRPAAPAPIMPLVDMALGGVPKVLSLTTSRSAPLTTGTVQTPAPHDVDSLWLERVTEFAPMTSSRSSSRGACTPTAPTTGSLAAAGRPARVPAEPAAAATARASSGRDRRSRAPRSSPRRGAGPPRASGSACGAARRHRDRLRRRRLAEPHGRRRPGAARRPPASVGGPDDGGLGAEMPAGRAPRGGSAARWRPPTLTRWPPRSRRSTTGPPRGSARTWSRSGLFAPADQGAEMAAWAWSTWAVLVAVRAWRSRSGP